MQSPFERFIEGLGLPEASHLDQKLFKKQFYELAKMGRTQQEQFAKEVESIVWTHTLKKGTINIPPLVTDTVEYLEVAYIHVNLHERTHFKKVAEVIHRIPYPVVLLLTHKEQLCISTAPKRINQADISKLTVESYFYSEWIDLQNPTEAQQAFLESLKVKHLSFENFQAFYKDICDRIVALEASALGTGFSTDQTSQKKRILDKIQPLQEKIASLKSAIKKETQFNAKVRLNMQVKKLSEEIEALKMEL